MAVRMVTGILGLAVKGNGQYLLTLRNEPEEPDVHRKWQVPGGGMEYGETALDTLKRELLEEVRIDHFSLLFPYPMTYRALFETDQDKIQVNLFCYLIDIGEQTPVVGDEETLELGWFSVDAMRELDLLGGTADFVAEAEKIRTKYSLASG